MTGKDIGAITISFVIALIFAAWVNRTAKHEKTNPLPWTVGTVVLWPVTTLIAGWHFRNLGLIIAGLIGCKFLCRFLDFFVIARLVKTAAPIGLEYVFIWGIALVLALKHKQQYSKTATLVMFAATCQLVGFYCVRILEQLFHSTFMQAGLIDTFASCCNLLAVGALLFALFGVTHVSQKNKAEPSNQ